MYLIDTSVWIDYFRGENNRYTKYFSSILDERLPFGITGVIYQEILQGASSHKVFKQLIRYLSTQHFFHPKDKILTYEAAAELYFKCRRKGVTLRSTIDCLIAQIAVEYELVLLHKDKDYEHISTVLSALKLAPA